MKRRTFLFSTCLLLWTGSLLAALRYGSEPRSTFKSGDLELTISNSGRGIVVEGLRDALHQQEFLASPGRSLFTLTIRQNGLKDEGLLQSDTGWEVTAVTRGHRRLTLTWSNPTNAAWRGVTVTAVATASPASSAIRWTLRADLSRTNCSLSRVAFPDLALGDLGSRGALFFPRGPGEVQTNVWARPFSYHGNYPDGWCAMQFVAAYAESLTGLFVATCDPWGSTKEILLQSQPEARALRLTFEHPAPNLGVPGNGFVLPGDAVWQVLRGNWFDAAMTYRQWARREAKWWPRLARDGRADTPRWMRELSAWAMTGGAPGECVKPVIEFRRYLGVPVGFHWYNWHLVPFDNDYPHYFPAKDSFADGVAELKSAAVFPMPYINGRLWDSHDRGADDFEFSRLALPAVTKKEDRSPHLETYGSKETNGEPVRLGVMCPSTPLWRNTVSNIVLRLLRECGTSGVYIDQVAAAAPKLCMDAAHGHPLGGGHWWTESYWKLLEDLRRAMPPGTMLTTECNAEPFVRWFDGYLTWHWQHNGQVPAFPAVYGGTVQMFGRAYRGGTTKDLALRMKAAQQLVFGEQLGWLDPAVAKEPENAEFFRNLALVRSKFARCFYAGEMARPPKLLGQIPIVKADWQWSGEWWVSTDAVLTGAWRVPREHRLVLLFVNVSDGPVVAKVQDDAAGWGVATRRARCQVTLRQAPPLASSRPSPALSPAIVELAGTRPARLAFEQPVTFAPREVQAWEFRW